MAPISLTFLSLLLCIIIIEILSPTYFRAPCFLSFQGIHCYFIRLFNKISSFKQVLRKADMIRKNAVESILAERDILITVRNPFVVSEPTNLTLFWNAII